MAIPAATKRSGATRVSSDGSAVHFIGGGEVRTSRGGSKRDHGLWNADVEWLLCCSSAELGQRGTMASVVSTIERGGGPGGGEDPNLAMLRRFGWAEEPGKLPRNPLMARERQLTKRWTQLERPHQQALVAHYLLTPAVEGKIRARCGMLSGVVLARWMEEHASVRRGVRGEQVAKVQDLLAPLHAELDPILRSIANARAARAEANARYLETLPRDPLVLAQAQGIKAALRFLDAEARPLRRQIATLRARESVVAGAGSPEADLRALTAQCERGEVVELVSAGETAVRAAHEAWQATGWDEPKQSRREARQARADAFLAEVGL